MSIRLNFCRSVPLELLRSFLHLHAHNFKLIVFSFYSIVQLSVSECCWSQIGFIYFPSERKMESPSGRWCWCHGPAKIQSSSFWRNIFTWQGEICPRSLQITSGGNFFFPFSEIFSTFCRIFFNPLKKYFHMTRRNMPQPSSSDIRRNFSNHSDGIFLNYVCSFLNY